jgi:hypothetical protein
VAKFFSAAMSDETETVHIGDCSKGKRDDAGALDDTTKVRSIGSFAVRCHWPLIQDLQNEASGLSSMIDIAASSKKLSLIQDLQDEASGIRSKSDIAASSQKLAPKAKSSSSKGSTGSRRAVQQLKGGNVVATYPSMRAGSEETGINRKMMGCCCNGKRDEAGGFQWKYVSEDAACVTKKLPPKVTVAQNLREKVKSRRLRDSGVGLSSKIATAANNKKLAPQAKRSSGRKAVHKLKGGDVVATFPSISAGSRETGIDIYFIGYCCNGKRDEAGGFQWKFVSEDAASGMNKLPSKVTAAQDLHEKAGGPKPVPVDAASSKKLASRSKKSSPSVDEYEVPVIENFTVFYTEITEEGPLGVKIAHIKPSRELRKALQASKVTSFVTGCIVENVKPDSLCAKAGIRYADCLLLVEDSSTRNGKPRLRSEFPIIRDLGRQGDRPITFCVIRDHGADFTDEDEESEEHPWFIAKPQLKRAPPPNESTKKMPFCAICTSRAKKHRVHHAWCPEHPEFKGSHAEKVLERILGGTDLGCNRCMNEYLYGRIALDKKHTKLCEKNQERLLKAANEVSSSDDIESSVNRPSPGEPSRAEDENKKKRSSEIFGEQNNKSSKRRLQSHPEGPQTHRADDNESSVARARLQTVTNGSFSKRVPCKTPLRPVQEEDTTTIVCLQAKDVVESQNSIARPRGCDWDPKRDMREKNDIEHAASLNDDSVSSKSAASDHREGNDSDSEIRGEDGAIRGVGSSVLIRGHQSPGVCNPEGIAHVEKAYKNGDDDQVYNVKYCDDDHVAEGVLDSYVQQAFNC